MRIEVDPHGSVTFRPVASVDEMVLVSLVRLMNNGGTAHIYAQKTKGIHFEIDKGMAFDDPIHERLINEYISALD